MSVTTSQYANLKVQSPEEKQIATFSWLENL